MKLIHNAVALLAGVLSLGLFRYLPGYGWFSLLVLLLPFAIVRKRWIALFFLIGHLWAAVDAWLYIDSRLKPEDHRTDQIVTGRIVDFPRSVNSAISFELESEEFGGHFLKANRIRLKWQDAGQIPMPGEKWRFEVRLFMPRGMLNQGGFDYEGWLFSNDIIATGYVRGAAERLANAGISSVNRLRTEIAGLIERGNGQHPVSTGLLKALLIGDKTGLSEASRKVFQETGTAHLIAISGLHIGLIAAICWYLFSFLWSRSLYLMRLYPAPVIGAVAAISGALIYSALAGFSLPTQRALVMTLVFSGATIMRLSYLPIDRLAIALVAVILFDPASVWQVGFWFSFCAVLLLILLYQHQAIRGKLMMAFSGQLLLSLLMLPMQAQAGMILAFTSPLVNLVAVPWFSFVLVPLAFVSILFAPVVGDFTVDWLLRLCDLTLWGIESVSDLVEPTYASYQGQLASFIAISAVLLGTMHWQLKRLVLLLLVYLSSWIKLPEQNPYLRITFFDVGQGESLLIETARHKLLYDLGPAYRSGFNTAESVLIPYFRSRGIDSLDSLVISHDDRDHAGNAEGFLQAIPVRQFIVGQAIASTGHFMSKPCSINQAWEWDGIRFSCVHPATRSPSASDNDSSCVLVVEGEEMRILVSGDITAKVEQQLIGRVRGDFSVVTAPHHGSLTSSSPTFVKWAQTEYAIVSAGWRNHYNHPRPEVVDRWQQSGAVLLNTAETGMLTLSWKRGEKKPQIELYRQMHGFVWNR